MAIAGTPDGGFIIAQSINNFDSGKASRIDADGRPVWNRTIYAAFKAITPAHEGGWVVPAGTRIFRFDANGNTGLGSVVSTSISQAASGGFIAERCGVPYPGASVFRLDDNGRFLVTFLILF